MDKERKKIRKRLLFGCLFFLLSAFFLLAARRIPGFAGWYADTVYPVFVGTIGRFFGLFPFSAAELGLYAGILAVLYFLGAAALMKRSWLSVLSALWAALGGLLFSYAACCGVNYYRPPFSAYLERVSDAGSRENLLALCEWLGEQVQLSREALELEMERDPDCWERLPEKGVEAMEMLALAYPRLEGYYPKPKPVTVSEILSVQQCSGVYSPFTIEANYNQDMVSYNIPHTICHELSHLRGFMREDEANFIGYLACLASEDAAYRYSGALLGWICAGNALAKVDPVAYIRLYEELPDMVKIELEENTQFWARYEGKTAEAAEAVNDAYLKVNGQAEGVKTYGRVVDLMLEDFVKNRRAQ